MPVVSAYAQPFSLGLMGGAGLTQDFQNYNVPPCCPPFQVAPTYCIVGSSNSAALDRRRDVGGAAAAASLDRGRRVVPRATVQNGDPVRPNSTRLGKRPTAACRDLGVSCPVEVPFPATPGETVYQCGPRVEELG